MESKRPTPTTGLRTESSTTSIQPTNVSAQLNELSSLSSELWREVGFERLINRFIGQVSRRITPTRASLFDYQSDESGKLHLTASSVKLRREHQLQKEFQELALSRLESTLNSKADNSDGIINFQVGEQNFGLILLGDTQIHRWLLLVRFEAEPNRNSVEAQAILDFLSRQLQYAAVWSCRLDSTQSQLYRDDLTGLYNTRYLEEVLEKEVRRASRFGTRFCVFFVDLDNLKEVNDQHGHLTGSSILKQFADILRVQLREVDSIIRYGGDEYIVLLLGASAEVGAVVAERLRKRIENHDFLTTAGAKIRITCSIGIAAFPDHGKTKDELLKIADDSMYRGKRGGKNQVIIAGQEIQLNQTKNKRATS